MYSIPTTQVIGSSKWFPHSTDIISMGLQDVFKYLLPYIINGAFTIPSMVQRKYSLKACINVFFALQMFVIFPSRNLRKRF